MVVFSLLSIILFNSVKIIKMSREKRLKMFISLGFVSFMILFLAVYRWKPRICIKNPPFFIRSCFFNAQPG